MAERQVLTTVKLNEADLRRVLNDMRDELQAAEIPAAKRALQQFVERVEANDDEAAIVYRPGVILASTRGDKFVPPRGFELIPCTHVRLIGPLGEPAAHVRQ